MTNILTANEAANALRCDVYDQEMLDLLPQVDRFIINATGYDWTTDITINQAAKSAARMLLVMWHEDPAMMAQRNAPLSFGLMSALVQLEALAAEHLEFQGLMSSGPCTLLGARMGDTVSSLVGLIGCSGNQAANFESVITVDDQIKQVSSSDLSAKWFRVWLIPVGHL